MSTGLALAAVLAALLTAGPAEGPTAGPTGVPSNGSAAVQARPLMPIPQGALLLDRVAAVVDREVITVSDVERAARIQLARRGGGADAARVPLGPDLMDAVLNLLIAEELVLQDGRRRGVVPDADEQTQRAAAAFRRQMGDEGALAFVQALHLTDTDWLEHLRREAQVELLLREQLRGVTVTDAEVVELVRKVPELLALPPEEGRRQARALLEQQASEKRTVEHMESLRLQASIRIPSQASRLRP